MKDVNVLKLLTLKKDVKCVAWDSSLHQAIEKMRFHGYTALPVLDDRGKYMGTVSEGDLLYALMDGNDLSQPFNKFLRWRFNPAVSVDTPFAKLIRMTLDYNFIPLVDDRGVLIGILTRKALMGALLED